ncbi:MAG: hypothetical protein SGJ02_03785 [bacterium]|nr:hypothetical protein [bacterium]
MKLSIIAYGEDNGQIWLQRKFHQNTLSNIENINSGIASFHPVEQAQKIIALVATMQDVGIVHGHITTTNIGADEEQPVLFDFGFAATEILKTESLAPEIKSGMPSTFASDIYGLGLTLKVILGTNLSPKHKELIDSMLSSETSKRPSIEFVKNAFAVPTATSILTPSNVGKVLPSGNLISARIIESTQKSLKGESSKSILLSSSQKSHLHRSDQTKISTQDVSKIRIAIQNQVRQSTVALPRSKLPINSGAETYKPVAKMESAISSGYNSKNIESKQKKITQTSVSHAVRKHTELISPFDVNQLRDSDNLKLDIALIEKKKAPQKQIQTTHVISVSSDSEKIRSFSRTIRFITLAGLTSLICLLIGFAWSTSIKRKSPKEKADYSAYWLSDQPSLQQKVIEDIILKESSEAEAAILKALTDGTKVKGIRNELLRVAFGNFWAKDLSKTDRKILFALSLENNDPKILNSLPPIAKANPGVILTLLSQMPGRNEAISGLPISTFFMLPDPYGKAFFELSKLNIQNIGEEESIGLVKFVIGDVTKKSISEFIANRPEGKLEIVNILFEKERADLAEKFIRLVSTALPEVFPNIEWFYENSDVDWIAAPAITKIQIALGIKNFSGLSFEHQLDLLSFPDPKIKSAAASEIENALGTDLKPMLNIAISPESNLTRTQVISLISALSFKGQDRKGYISIWFGTNPESSAVIKLLLARSTTDKNDFFNLEASRYLANKDWKVDFETLKKLSVHLEPVARALAYSKMDPEDSEQRKFMRKMASIEPSPSVRKGIIEKIKPFQARSTLKNLAVD